MAKRRKLKSANQIGATQKTVHDRRATDVPLNAQVAIVEIDDPYENGARITAVRSLKDDVLARMHACSQIDDCQFEAGRTMQNYYESATIGWARGHTALKEYVDGGTIGDPLSEEIRKAMREIARLEKKLGLEGTALVRDVLAEGYSIKVSASSRGLDTRYGREFIGARFRECLETLARELGYVSGRSVR